MAFGALPLRGVLMARHTPLPLSMPRRTLRQLSGTLSVTIDLTLAKSATQAFHAWNSRRTLATRGSDGARKRLITTRRIRPLSVGLHDCLFLRGERRVQVRGRRRHYLL